jgi:hypothetical protein
MRKHLTFANALSLVALFVALSGGAYAAAGLLPNSVGSRQLRAHAVTNAKLARNSVGAAQLQRGAVTNAKLAPGAVTGSDVAPGSLTGADINLATLGKVPAAAVADSASVGRVAFATASGTASPGGTSSDTATCPAGLVVVGGGATVTDEDNEAVNDSYPSGPTGWTAHVFNASTSATGFSVYAICVPAASTS